MLDATSIIEALNTLTVADLRRVKAEVDRIAELHSYGQQHALADLTPTDNSPTYRQEYTKCGKATCKKCGAGQLGHGPYWYSYHRDHGQLKKTYIGKHKPANTK